MKIIIKNGRILNPADSMDTVANLLVEDGRVVRIAPMILDTDADQIIDAAADVQRKTPLELFEELYEMQNNQPMSEEQRTFAQDLIESIWEERI